MCGEPSPKRGAVIAPPASSSKAKPAVVVRHAARRGASPAVSGRDARALERAQLLESASEEARGRPVSKTTSEVRAAERARVLAAVGGIDPSNRTTCATPPRGANGVSADASIQPLLRECPKRAVERVDTHLLLGGVIRKRQSKKWDDGKGPRLKNTFGKSWQTMPMVCPRR